MSQNSAPRLHFSKEAFLCSAGLSAFLIVVYDGCNTLTSLRSGVGVLCFSWERAIPFLPVMILPYLSMNLFFVAAPFVCRDNRELKTLCGRIAASILIAAVCFLTFPLRLGFDRPPVDGFLGLIIDRFRAFDKPYNMLPSLHVILVTVLADTYARHSAGAWRRILLAWFLIVGLSTLLTKQHHLVDVVTGFAVGLGVVSSVRKRPSSRQPLCDTA